LLAVRLTAPGRLSLSQESAPQPRDGQVLLSIEAVGICGSDIHRYRGDEMDSEEPDTPLILGHEFSATVLKTGSEVAPIENGDRVAVEAGWSCGRCEWCLKGWPNLCPGVRFCGTPPTDGALREMMVWPAHLLYKLPETLTFEDGVMAEVLGIALHAIDLANLRPGFSAAVLGAGPIGLCTINVLRRVAGAAMILASDRLDYRCRAAQRLGADRTWNAERENPVERVLEATGGRGVDVVFEAAGHAETPAQAVRICAPGGRVILIGIPRDDRTPFPTAPARRKGLTFRFVRRSKLAYDRALTLMERGAVDARSLITHHFALVQVQKAFDLVDQYRDGVIKAVIHPGRER